MAKENKYSSTKRSVRKFISLPEEFVFVGRVEDIKVTKPKETKK